MSFAAPFIGPAISAIGGILNRGGGKGMREQYGNVQGTEKNLSDVFNYGMNTGKAGYNAGTTVTGSGLGTVGTGLNTLSGPTSFWKTMASGNRPAVMQTLAPETNAALAQNDATRRQAVASGTARGGGLAAPMAKQKSDMMAQIDNMLFGARPMANQELTKIGTTQAQVGLGEADVGQSMVQKALAMLGLGANATDASGRLAIGAMGPEQTASASTIGTLTDAAGNAINNAANKWPKAFGLPVPA